jgi:rod shape-determining protein MreD
MIFVELVEARFPWRGFFQDWLFAGVIVSVYLVIAALFAGARIHGTTFVVLGPQLLFSIVLIPIVSRLVAGLDRLRLRRVRLLR